MQHYIRLVTSDLLSRITDEQIHYTPAELIAAGFPEFLVQRIRLELQRNLAESVNLPDSDWADMQADPVQDAWDNFLEAIHAEIRVPESYLRSVVENAVEDILELLAEPEKYTIDTLFRQEENTSILEMHARRPWIVLNGHLADAVMRYMQRRNLQSIDRKKAANIIRQIDQHLASGYTPLKWAQALDVCFMLMGHRVPSTLVARYFADKGLTDISRRMEAADEELTRSRLIEYLSIPSLIWDAEDEQEDNEEVVEGSTIAATPTKEFEIAAEQEDEVISIFEAVQREASVQHEEHESADDVTNADPFGLNDLDTETNDTDSHTSVLDQFLAEIEETSDADVDENVGDDSDSLYAKFAVDDQVEDDITEEDSEEITTTYAAEINPELTSEDDDEPESESSPIVETDNYEVDKPFYLRQAAVEEEDEEDEQTDESIPIWQRFISEDTEAEDELNTPIKADANKNMTNDSSIAGASSQNDHPQLSTKARELLSQLDTNAPLFVDHLFDGNIHSFYVTLNNLVTYNNWRDAGRYLTRDVFVPQEVDLYSGEAILFIDLLQQYFEEQS